MVRVKFGKTRRQRKKRAFKKAKGFFLGRSNLYRMVSETLKRAGKFAYRDRRFRKREFRSLWIIRVNAAVRARGLSYSQFMGALRKAGIALNRKQLSEIALHDPKGFDQIVDVVKKAS